ncbi:hypothetical protein ABK040_003296 [Willaertia magna]
MPANKNSIESQLGRDKEKQGERHEGLLQDSREHARGGSDISSGSTFSNKNDNKTSSTFSDQSSNLTK